MGAAITYFKHNRISNIITNLKHFKFQQEETPFKCNLHNHNAHIHPL
jgi:hypothetical protein